MPFALVAPAWPGKVGTQSAFSLANYLASVGGSLWDFADLSTLSQDAAGTTPVTGFGDPIGRAVDRISGKHATQATSSARPALQAAGARFDGNDDYLTTPYLAGAAANFMVALLDIPASVANSIFAGASEPGSPLGRFYLTVTAAGVLGGGIGNLDQAVIFDPLQTDYRSKKVVVGLTCNGTTTRLFVGDVLADERAQSGTPTTLTPIYIGARNVNNTSVNRTNVAVTKLLAGKDYLTSSLYQQIRATL